MSTTHEHFNHRNCFVNPDNARSFIDDWKHASPRNWPARIRHMEASARGLALAYRFTLHDERGAKLCEQAAEIYAQSVESEGAR